MLILFLLASTGRKQILLFHFWFRIWKTHLLTLSLTQNSEFLVNISSGNLCYTLTYLRFFFIIIILYVTCKWKQHFLLLYIFVSGRLKDEFLSTDSWFTLKHNLLKLYATGKLKETLQFFPNVRVSNIIYIKLQIYLANILTLVSTT